MTTRRHLLFATGALTAHAADLAPKTVQSFAAHMKQREAGVQAARLQGSRFLWAEDDAARLQKVRAGEVVIDKSVKANPIEVPGGLIHDWTGSILIPGTTTARVVGMVQNYDRHKSIYRPEVVDSKLLSRDGNDFRIFLRLVKKKVLTAVLNTEHDVRYFPVSSTRVHSRSYSSKISEVKDPGTPQETELPPGEGHGFLWKLNSFWRFDQRDEGVYVECEAISLTRGIPFGLGWMIEPIIRELPLESLEKALVSTREAAKRGA